MGLYIIYTIMHYICLSVFLSVSIYGSNGKSGMTAEMCIRDFSPMLNVIKPAVLNSWLCNLQISIE